MQRALMQYRSPKNQPIVRKALRLAGRDDLIGYDRESLVPPEGTRRPAKPGTAKPQQRKTTARPVASDQKKPQVKRSSKWAKAKPKKR